MVQAHPQGAPAPQQPQQPVATATQQPTTPQYSTEDKMASHIAPGNVSINVVLDADTYKVLQEAAEVHQESIVNLGIKLFAKTHIYKEFMIKNEYKTLDTKTEDIVTAVETSAVEPAAPTSTVSSSAPASAPAAPKATGFASW